MFWRNHLYQGGVEFICIYLILPKGYEGALRSATINRGQKLTYILCSLPGAKGVNFTNVCTFAISQGMQGFEFSLWRLFK